MVRNLKKKITQKHKQITEKSQKIQQEILPKKKTFTENSKKKSRDQKNVILFI